MTEREMQMDATMEDMEELLQSLKTKIIMVVDLYEPQYLALIVFGGFVALSFVVYAFSAFGIQEKSYEQAVAEQRARLEKEQIQQREGKRQKCKQFFEKKKREREKHDSSPGILRQEVAQAIDPYVEEVEQAPPTPPPVKEEKVKPEKVKPSPKKPKQPKPPKQSPVEETIFEAKPAPVQETLPPPKEAHTTKSKPPKVVEEQVQKKEAPVVAAAAPPLASPSKAKAKAKTAAGDGDPSALKGKTLISAVKSAPLKDAEIQQLIEILLNRQGGSASADDWVKANQRNDPVSALKKQLQEKEQALHNAETLGASAQSCSGAPLSHLVSNAPSTLSLTPVTTAMTSTDTRRSLRQHLMRGDPSLGVSDDIQPLFGDLTFTGGTAQVQDTNIPFTYTSGAHMSSSIVTQHEHQPVSTDQGTLDIPHEAFLRCLATAQPMEEDSADEELTTSLQRINAIAHELMSAGMSGGATGGGERVIVEQMPDTAPLSDLTYSVLETIDIAAYQDIGSDIVYSTFEGSDTERNNTSNSNNSNKYPMG